VVCGFIRSFAPGITAGFAEEYSVVNALKEGVCCLQSFVLGIPNGSVMYVVYALILSSHT
jgi:hypothetical protein